MVWAVRKRAYNAILRGDTLPQELVSRLIANALHRP